MKEIDLIGWIGCVIFLVLYILLSYGKINPKKKLFHGINFLGAAGLGVYAYGSSAWPFVVLEGVWAIVAVTNFFKKMPERKINKGERKCR